MFEVVEVIAQVDGVEVLAPIKARRVFVVAANGQTIVLGGRARRRPPVVVEVAS